MPAQKRSLPCPLDNQPEGLLPNAYDGDGGSPPPASSSVQQPRRRRRQEDGEEGEQQQQQEERDVGAEDDKEAVSLQEDQKDDSECDVDDGGSPSSSGAAVNDKNEYVLVKLADIRREVQCPICLGIIRKTRTVMECLHRFCRECIDKSMRLGNNECPACRTHCASRRSLRDDPNYDALISALYPDIDKYEEEELAFHEEDKLRNKKIQASIAETYQRQSEALGKRRSSAKATAAVFLRRSQGNFRNNLGHNSFPRSRSRSSCRDTGLAASDEDDEDANGNDGGKDSSSADESSPDVVRLKRQRRWGAPRFSPAPMSANVDESYDEQDDLEVGREPLGASPGRVGNRDVLVWGKNGTRSQTTRHGSSGGSIGKNVKGSRIAKLIEYLRNLDETDNELDIHLTLRPLDEQNLPNLQQPYLCCRPTLCVRHLCQFIAGQISVQAEEVEILARMPGSSLPKSSALAGDNDISQGDVAECRELQILEAQESLAGLHDYFSWSRGDLVLVYRSKSHHNGIGPTFPQSKNDSPQMSL